MKFAMETYRPLPEGLTVKQSKIDGLGLHASKSFDAGTKFGESHVLVHSRDRHEWIRTPLGGFFNHSNEPNCEAIYDGDFIKIKTLKNINLGDEITVDYTKHDWIKINQ